MEPEAVSSPEKYRANSSMISVIIPAHNESAVIDRCLSGILQGAESGELEVLVVCNGCTDDTADRARAYGDPVRIIETEIASKNNALNLGDWAARGFPRFFVDADILLPLESIRKVAEVLRGGRYLAAAPQLRLDLRGSSWAVRAYHAVWMALPYVNERMLGSGVYAVSEAGRERFERFPNIIADDCMVRLAFEDHEKTSVDAAWFELTPPATLRSLVHINVRRRVGLYEMLALHPEVVKKESRHQRLALLQVALRPSLWPALLVYVYAKVATVVVFSWKRYRGRHKEWNRDDTTREGLPAARSADHTEAG
jgi:glycosyltransferase involved in cell wall biosynthesis